MWHPYRAWVDSLGCADTEVKLKCMRKLVEMAVFCGGNLRVYEADNEGNILTVPGEMHEMFLDLLIKPYLLTTKKTLGRRDESQLVWSLTNQWESVTTGCHPKSYGRISSGRKCGSLMSALVGLLWRPRQLAGFEERCWSCRPLWGG